MEEERRMEEKGRTSTIRSHPRRAQRIMLIETALLDELLSHYVAG
jgi:hypothetical protein